MGTNYYMITKNKDLAHKYFAKECDYGGKYPEYVDQEYTLYDVPDFYYEIHLNKLSYGWQPIFQKHTAFSTFTELEQFYNEHKEDLIFKDEYDDEYTFEEYKQIVINHSNREPQPMRWVYKEDNMFGRSGHKYLMTEECKPEEADLWIPFDHSEYAKTQRDAQIKYKAWGTYSDRYDQYTKDPDYKFDWIEGDFS